MKTNEHYDEVRAYLKGLLPAEDRVRFEVRLGVEADLSKELALQRAETAAREWLLAAEARVCFQEWQQEQPLSKGRRIPLWLLGLATVFIVVLATLWWRYPRTSAVEEKTDPPALVPAPRESSPQPETPVPVAADQPQSPALPPKREKNYAQLALAHFQEPTFPNLRRPAVENSESLYRKAQQAYALGDYEQTLGLLAQVDSAREQSALFLAAGALFHLKKFEEAEANYQRLIEQNSRQYRYACEWGLLLCRLARSGEQATAFQEQLSAMIERPEHPYHEQAKVLQRALAQ